MNGQMSANFVDCLGTVVAMFASRSVATKYSAIMALTLAIFSAGFVVVHSCHSDQVKESAATGYYEFKDKSVSTIVSGNSFVANISSAIFFLVLLAVRKYVFKRNPRLIQQVKLQIFRLRSVTQRPPNIRYALSLPQLGVIRI